MNEELKPCPGCGKVPELSKWNQWYCDCGLANVADLKSEIGRECWNTRPIEDALRATIAARDAALAKRDSILNDIGRIIGGGRTSPDWPNNCQALVEEIQDELGRLFNDHDDNDELTLS